MASLKQKSKVEEIDNLREVAEEEAVNVADVLAEDDEPIFEFPAGYRDSDGVVHREFCLREMTGRDEEAMHKSDVRSNGSKIISVLLARCITRIGSLTPKSVGGSKKWEDLVKNLYTGDQDYAMLQLRKLSISDEIKVNHVCPNPDCKAKLETVLEIDELELIPFAGEREIPFELPKGYKDKKGEIHRTGVLRLPTGFDREILTPLAKTNIAKAETVMLTRLCTFSDGLPVDEDIMSSLSIKDREYLQKLLRDNYFGVKLEIEVTCDTCGETFAGSFNASNFM